MNSNPIKTIHCAECACKPPASAAPIAFTDRWPDVVSNWTCATPVADAEIKALYVSAHGSDDGWLSTMEDRVARLTAKREASNKALVMAKIALEEAIKLRTMLCENGDDADVPTPAIKYDKPIQGWTKALLAIKEAQS